MAILNAAYPAFYRNVTPKEVNEVVNVWYMIFQDDDPAIVTAAVRALIESDEKGYPPHIGAVKAKIRLITQPAEDSEIAVWNLVAKAVARTWPQKPSREFDKLPEDVRRTIGSPNVLVEWGKIDEDVFNSVTQSNFLKSYRRIREREREIAKLPADVRTLLEGMNLKQLED
jgi:hypothetical protein